MKTLNVVLAILILILVSIFVYRSVYMQPTVEVPEQTAQQKINKINETVRAKRDILFSETTSTEERVEAVKTLKEVSLDTSLEDDVRLRAGQPVTLSFFGYGMSAGEGFSAEPFVERDIFEYAKSLNALGDSDRNNLLTAYIGLRFFSDEIDEKFITDLLDSNKRFIAEKGSNNICSVKSKFASVIYLAKKHKNLDLSPQYGDYNTNFKNAINDCTGRMRVLASFMWLAALSDIGESAEEKQKAQELVTFLIKDTSPDATFVRYIRDAYLGENKEPDTVSIVERLVVMYPEFKTFIENIK